MTWTTIFPAFLSFHHNHSHQNPSHYASMTGRFTSHFWHRIGGQTSTLFGLSAVAGIWAVSESRRSPTTLNDQPWQMMRRLEASPTFSGVPVAATFLMHQAQTPFEKAFPGLEMSAVFSMHNTEDFSYAEFAEDPESVFSRLHARVFGPAAAQVSVPVYERLSQAEEERLGASGIRKAPVGTLVMKGLCRVGCAQVKLMQVTLTKMNGDVVWTWVNNGKASDEVNKSAISSTS